MSLKSAQYIDFEHPITSHISISLFFLQNTHNVMQSALIFLETIAMFCVGKELFLFVT